MCGIAGWMIEPGHTRDERQLIAMADSISHRGPDDRGVFLDPAGVAFVHNRLSIIDLTAAGHQPMASDDGSVVLSFNGEIYNFRDLRRELEGMGHQFKSRSDSEVLLHCYLQWGRQCADRLRGMFAFAIWSAPDHELFLARDPMGIKPLYYTALPGGHGFVFASEIKAFLALPDFGPKINPSALSQFLEFGYSFDGDETSLAGVYKLPPGHWMSVRNGRPEKPKPYFFPASAREEESATAAGSEESLYQVLSEVVEQHLIADVPVGLLLSGGIDSSLVAAIAARHTRITTITMAFSESAVDEREYARVVSRHIKSDHHEITIDPHEVSDGLSSVAWIFDDLFADWGTVSTRLMYLKCREQGIKVVLVGEGSDELFGGYPIFETAQTLSGPMTWRLFQLYRRYAGRRYGRQFPRFRSIMQSHLASEQGDLFGAVRLFESRNQLPNNYVMKVDKASMSVSVEARAPFLDRRVAEIAYRTPAGRLLQPGSNKHLLRSMAARYGLLPPEISNRPKFGASIAASWMDDSDQFRRFASQIILDKHGWVDQLGLRGAMTDFFAGKRQGYGFPRAISLFSNLAWRLLLLNLWSFKYLNA